MNPEGAYLLVEARVEEWAKRDLWQVPNVDDYSWLIVADAEGEIVRVNRDFEAVWSGSKERLEIVLRACWTKPEPRDGSPQASSAAWRSA